MDKIYILIKNKNSMIISMFPVTTTRNTDNCYLVNTYEYVFKELEWFIVGCFLLGVIVMIILLMQNNSRSYTNYNHNETNVDGNSNMELTSKLIDQLTHNISNINQVLSYNNFPTDHSGYLSLELRTKLVSILRSSIIADQYKYGSSIGTIYVKNTYRHPAVTSEMIGVVMGVEWNSR
jgi:hypothetical protein